MMMMAMKTRQVWDPRSVFSHCWLSSIVHTVSCIVHSPHYTALPWDTLHYTLATQPFNGRLINPAYRWNKTTLSQLQRLQEGTKNMYFSTEEIVFGKMYFQFQQYFSPTSAFSHTINLFGYSAYSNPLEPLIYISGNFPYLSVAIYKHW